MKADGMGGEVVFFGPGFSEIGGAQKRALLLTGMLAEKGWSVCGINRAGTRNSFWWLHRGRLRGIDVPGFNLQGGGALFYVFAGLMLGLYRARRASVLIAMQVGSQTFLAAMLGAILCKPFVVLTTSSGASGEVEALRVGRAAGLKRWALGQAAVVVVQTEAATKELEGLVDRSRVRVMPNPVRQGSPPPLNGLPRALFMGRLTEGKDLPNLLTAWSYIASDRPNAELTLLGEGGHHGSVETRLRSQVHADPSLARSVRFEGWVPDPARHLAASDVFAFPSLSEGMSNSLLEACAAGRVVVASEIPSNVVVLGETYPLLFPPGDLEALRGALSAALGDAEIRASALRCIRERLALFSTDRVGGLFEGILIEAQGRSRDQHPRGDRRS